MISAVLMVSAWSRRTGSVMESLTVETNQMKLPKTHFAQTQVRMETLKGNKKKKFLYFYISLYTFLLAVTKIK